MAEFMKKNKKKAEKLATSAENVSERFKSKLITG